MAGWTKVVAVSPGPIGTDMPRVPPVTASRPSDSGVPPVTVRAPETDMVRLPAVRSFPLIESPVTVSPVVLKLIKTIVKIVVAFRNAGAFARVPARASASFAGTVTGKAVACSRKACSRAPFSGTSCRACGRPLCSSPSFAGPCSWTG